MVISVNDAHASDNRPLVLGVRSYWQCVVRERTRRFLHFRKPRECALSTGVRITSWKSLLLIIFLFHTISLLVCFCVFLPYSLLLTHFHCPPMFFHLSLSLALALLLSPSLSPFTSIMSRCLSGFDSVCLSLSFCFYLFLPSSLLFLLHSLVSSYLFP